MSKMTVKEYIEKYTRRCSNELDAEPAEEAVYLPWLTPFHAEAVAHIAREETIEEVLNWLRNHYRDYMHNPTGKQLEAFFGIDMCNDLEKAMNQTEKEL